MITFLLIFDKGGLTAATGNFFLQESLTLMGTKHDTGNGRTLAFLTFCSYANLEFSSKQMCYPHLVSDEILFQINYSSQLTAVSEPREINRPHYCHGETLHPSSKRL